ncbi:CHAD domain-containing protein [bacterium]|nr:CHAD domain-containing protein [bacterium]
MPTPAIPDEIEVKLEATSGDVLDAIAGVGALGDYRLRRRRVAALQTTYLDTPTLALARAGVAVRLRRHGRRWEATAKWPGRVRGTLHTRPELTVPLAAPPAAPFRLPDGPLQETLQPYLLGRPLQPVLVTNVERRLVDVLPTAGGASLAELALDRVQVCHPDGTPAAPEYWEVEIEQRAGAAADCVAVGRALRRRFHLVPSRATKFARGLDAVLPAGTAAAPPPPISAADTLASATRAIIATQLGRLRAAQPAARRGDDPEAVHEMRVAIRRLRTALRLGRAALPARQRAALGRELGWLGGVLGQVRDLDVQLATADWHRARLAATARGPLDGLRRALRRQRLEALAALQQTFASSRYTRLLLALERAAAAPRRPPGGAGAEPIASAGRRAIKRAARKLRRLGDAVGELPHADELHRLRIRAKRLRYALEALKPITGRDGRRLSKQLTRLQDVLGRFNDSIVAAATVRRYRDALPTPVPPATRAALTAIADAELRRAGAAQGQFHRAWKRFSEKGARRRLASLLETLAALTPPAAAPPAS